MKQIIFILFLFISTHSSTAQSITYQFEEGDSYCTIEVDTTLTVNLGTFRAYKYLNVPYYEMTFRPEFDYTETGEKILIITPTWHYHAYLAKVHGEIEHADSSDSSFRLRLTMDEGGNTLALKSTGEERKKLLHRSSFSQKVHFDFTDFPETFTKVGSVNMNKFPKDLRKNLQNRMNKIKNRLN